MQSTEGGGVVWTLPILPAHPEGLVLFNLHEAMHYRYLTRRFHSPERLCFQINATISQCTHASDQEFR